MNKFIKKRLQAFTLIEISVTILLSLIIVGMMYMALHIITREMEQPQDKKAEQVALLKTALNQAFFQASTVEFSLESQALTCRDSSLIRQFVMGTQTIIFQTSKVPADTIWSGSYWFETEKNEEELVTCLNCWFPLASDTLKLVIFKNYSPATLINHKDISFEY